MGSGSGTGAARAVAIPRLDQQPRERLENSAWQRSVGFCQGASMAGRFHVKDGVPLLESSTSLATGEWLRVGSSAIAERLGLGASRFQIVARSEPTDDRPYFEFELSPAVGVLPNLRFLLNWYMPLLAAVLFIVDAITVGYLKLFNLRFFWYGPLLNLYSLMISTYIISRFAIAALYKPPPDAGITPSVTVIVACKDEEDSIYRTLECLYKSDYPGDRFDVIVVDDGSTDRTHEEMLRASRNFPNLEVIRFEKNRGKRDAMAVGAQRARHDILVYIDSDSFVRPNTIRKLVQGFDLPDVGAVCGHGFVHNSDENLLTRMQEVRYYIAFRVAKAAESVFSSVTCCSGCLAAYRRDIVMSFLDEWLDQRFLGTRATFGDDRSLTNYVLRRHRVIYDSEAECSTIVPSYYRKFFNQQTRWKKSWIRETLIASTFMWRRHPLAALSFYLGALFPLVAPLVVIYSFILPLANLESGASAYAAGCVLMSILYSLFYLGRFRNGMWVYGIAFSLFYMLVLVWQTYYALVTVRRNHWGTR